MLDVVVTSPPVSRQVAEFSLIRTISCFIVQTISVVDGMKQETKESHFAATQPSAIHPSLGDGFAAEFAETEDEQEGIDDD